MKQKVKELMQRHKLGVQETAKLMGINRQNFWKKMKGDNYHKFTEENLKNLQKNLQ